MLTISVPSVNVVHVSFVPAPVVHVPSDTFPHFVGGSVQPPSQPSRHAKYSEQCAPKYAWNSALGSVHTGEPSGIVPVTNCPAGHSGLAAGSSADDPPAGGLQCSPTWILSLPSTSPSKFSP